MTLSFPRSQRRYSLCSKLELNPTCDAGPNCLGTAPLTTLLSLTLCGAVCHFIGQLLCFVKLVFELFSLACQLSSHEFFMSHCLITEVAFLTSDLMHTGSLHV